MSFQEYKIADSDISEKGVVAAPDKLTGKARENKMVFDRLIREAVKEHYNRLIDALEAAGANAIIQTGSGDTLRYLRLNSDKVLESSANGTVWEATGSSGHIVVGPDGSQLPQRSRLNFAKLICQLTGRDTAPDTSAYSGHIQYFTDVSGSSVGLVTEVSHEHDYILDVDGNEYWI